MRWVLEAGEAGLGVRGAPEGRAQPQSAVCGPPAAERPLGIDVPARPPPGHSPRQCRKFKTILINLAKETPIFSKCWRLVVGKSFKVVVLSSSSIAEFNRILKVCFDCFFKNGFTKPRLELCKRLPGDSGSTPPPRLPRGPHLSSYESSSPYLGNVFVLQCKHRHSVLLICYMSLGSRQLLCEHTFKKHNFIELRVCNRVDSVEVCG